MAKVFMSVLGTSPYVEVSYELNGRRSVLTPFVQEAYLNLTRKDWTEGDRIVFFLTEEARHKNWEDGGNFEKGLRTRLKGLGLPIKAVSLKEGHTAKEIMDNFQVIVDALEPGDEVVFDITHSFRSLPMLNLVALNYARVLRGIKISSIYYGAFEVLGSPNEVKNIPISQRIAPIFDLTPYVTLLDWSFAVDDFVRYGMTERVRELVEERTGPILKETQGGDEKARSLGNFVKSLHGLAMNIYTCRCRDLMERDWKSLDLEELGQSYTLLPPFVPLFEKLESKVSGFVDGDSWSRAEAAVEWCLEHGMIQQGYTILQEAIVTETARIMGVEGVYNKEHREFVSSLLSVTAQKKPSEEWRGILQHRREEALEWQRKGGEHFKKLSEAFSQLAQMRNDINHCGCKENPVRPKVLIDGLERCFSEARKSIRKFAEVLDKR